MSSYGLSILSETSYVLSCDESGNLKLGFWVLKLTRNPTREIGWIGWTQDFSKPEFQVPDQSITKLLRCARVQVYKSQEKS